MRQRKMLPGDEGSGAFTGSVSIPPAPPEDLTLLLEEYRALRVEITNALQAQHAALSYGIAALALFIVAIASAWDKSPGLTAMTLMTVVPMGILFLFAVWGTEIGRMRRAGSYIASYLKPRVNLTASVQNGLAWEGWLAGRIAADAARRRFRKPRSLD